jgi:hypothetical protein
VAERVEVAAEPAVVQAWLGLAFRHAAPAARKQEQQFQAANTEWRCR